MFSASQRFDGFGSSAFAASSPVSFGPSASSPPSFSPCLARLLPLSACCPPRHRFPRRACPPWRKRSTHFCGPTEPSWPRPFARQRENALANLSFAGSSPTEGIPATVVKPAAATAVLVASARRPEPIAAVATTVVAAAPVARVGPVPVVAAAPVAPPRSRRDRLCRSGNRRRRGDCRSGPCRRSRRAAGHRAVGGASKRVHRRTSSCSHRRDPLASGVSPAQGAATHGSTRSPRPAKAAARHGRSPGRCPGRCRAAV